MISGCRRRLLYLWLRVSLAFHRCVLCGERLGWYRRHDWFQSITSGELMHTDCLGADAAERRGEKK